MSGALHLLDRVADQMSSAGSPCDELRKVRAMSIISVLAPPFTALVDGLAFLAIDASDFIAWCASAFDEDGFLDRECIVKVDLLFLFFQLIVGVSRCRSDLW